MLHRNDRAAAEEMSWNVLEMSLEMPLEMSLEVEVALAVLHLGLQVRVSGREVTETSGCQVSCRGFNLAS